MSKPVSASANVPVPVEELTYEQARAELIQVVQALEAGSQALEEALALWERGEVLAGRCQEWLDAARDRIAARSGEAAAAD
ncbi:MAG: exodeoxyribonuclease VII small subunit [Bifidobacteriaceae bacterium]|nr:exodeoxyribonuclease VII small subunit [Bifidobacteriaceae bacterium]